MGTQAGCAAVTVALYFYYRWQNKKRDERRGLPKENESSFMSQDAWADVTDQKNPRFSYCY
jgi:hypothetical protein